MKDEDRRVHVALTHPDAEKNKGLGVPFSMVLWPRKYLAACQSVGGYFYVGAADLRKWLSAARTWYSKQGNRKAPPPKIEVEQARVCVELWHLIKDANLEDGPSTLPFRKRFAEITGCLIPPPPLLLDVSPLRVHVGLVGNVEHQSFMINGVEKPPVPDPDPDPHPVSGDPNVSFDEAEQVHSAQPEVQRVVLGGQLAAAAAAALKQRVVYLEGQLKSSQEKSTEQVAVLQRGLQEKEAECRGLAEQLAALQSVLEKAEAEGEAALIVLAEARDAAQEQARSLAVQVQALQDQLAAAKTTAPQPGQSQLKRKPKSEPGEGAVPVVGEKQAYSRQNMKQRSGKARKGASHAHRNEKSYEKEKERREQRRKEKQEQQHDWFTLQAEWMAEVRADPKNLVENICSPVVDPETKEAAVPQVISPYQRQKLCDQVIGLRHYFLLMAKRYEVLTVAGDSKVVEENETDSVHELTDQAGAHVFTSGRTIQEWYACLLPGE